MNRRAIEQRGMNPADCDRGDLSPRVWPARDSSLRSEWHKSEAEAAINRRAIGQRRMNPADCDRGDGTCCSDVRRARHELTW